MSWFQITKNHFLSYHKADVAHEQEDVGHFQHAPQLPPSLCANEMKRLNVNGIWNAKKEINSYSAYLKVVVKVAELVWRVGFVDL